MERAQAKAMMMEYMGWDEAEFNDRERWVVDNCICSDCPSYVAQETEMAFCWAAIGDSEIITDENDCVCGQCAVFNQAQLRLAYYCTRGSELGQLDELSQEGGAEQVA